MMGLGDIRCEPAGWVFTFVFRDGLGGLDNAGALLFETHISLALRIGAAMRHDLIAARTERRNHFGAIIIQFCIGQQGVGKIIGIG